ncbi:hypothetical protein B0O80DRAFT_424431 [Mortierella sp. GBAus27b]|nr:hypothetical protein B0O80DRAFT_424431 [Mortierella sp. GBAus27b]
MSRQRRGLVHGRYEEKKIPVANQLYAQVAFEDTDINQQLLRKRADRAARMVDNDDPTAMRMRWAALWRLRQSRKQLYTKASKGRRLRYHVHEKLQSSWRLSQLDRGMERVDELLLPLLGQEGDGMTNHDDHKVGNEETEENKQAEQEQFEDDRLCLFG